jgi:hypothetical protein
MQLQTAVKTDAFASMGELSPEEQIFMPEDRRERYFFFAGDEPGRDYPGGLSVNTPCVPNRLIRRCQVTPCITIQWPKRIVEIPEGRRIEGTMNFRPGFAKEWLYSGPEAGMLLSDYGNPGDPARQRGLVELDVLLAMPWSTVRDLHITDTIFPSWPDIPKTNTEVLIHLEETGKRISEDKQISIDRKKIYLACINKMSLAVSQADAYQSETVVRSNLAITLPSTEPGYKRDFDARDYLFSERTGIPLAVNSLRQNQSNMVEQLVAKLQPVAPQVDPTTIATIAAAVVKAMREMDEAEPKGTRKTKSE